MAKPVDAPPDAALTHRRAPVEVDPTEFRTVGHALIEQIAGYLEAMPGRAIVPTAPSDVRARVQAIPWIADGEPLEAVVASAASLLLDHSTLTSHPRFWGYINGAASPIAALADLLGTAANPNASAWYVGPVTSAMEEQVVQWLAALTGFPAGCGGTLVSGGSMANLVGLAAARHALGAPPGALRIYASRDTHTWLAKAEAFLGLGAGAIRWIEPAPDGQITLDAVHAAVDADTALAGSAPTVIVASAGTTSTGAIDPIDALADMCDARGLWLHVDGAYGAPAACLPEAPVALRAIGRAHSLVLDPHKWLYTSIEAGCVLIRDRRVLPAAFTHGSPYYGEGQGELPPHFRDLGPQTSRGARAVKVWMCLRRAGRAGYEAMIRDDIALAHLAFDHARTMKRLEALTCSLSITTFRYVPDDGVKDPAYVDDLNAEIIRRLQEEGEVYPSKTTVNDRISIRICIVNFRTTRADIERLLRLVVETGDALHCDRGGASARS